MSTTAELGLRERKKAATRQSLHDAAVRLAIENGAGRITVEAIADAAGVSRRTFSNYFGSKEEALLYADLQRMHMLMAIVRARPAAETPWVALTAAAEEFYHQLGTIDAERVAQVRLVRGDPTLQAAQVQTFAALERELGAEVTARITDHDPSGVRARLTAAAFLMSMRVAWHAWLESPPGTELWDVASRTLAETGRGFA